MNDPWRAIVLVVGIAAIVALILFARGPSEPYPYPAHPIAAITRFIA